MTRQSCSWCHETNVMTGGPVTCRECGHRADVPRVLCDCGRPGCRTTPADLFRRLVATDGTPPPVPPREYDIGGEGS